MNTKLAYSVAAGCVLALLVALPFRNLHSLSACFGNLKGIMDVPASEMRLEVQLISLQVFLAIVGVAALVLGAQESRVLRPAGAGAWSLVALGGLLWDTWLGNFASPNLPPDSVYACLLEARSAHTHSVLSNAPLVLAGLMAIWVLRDLLRSNAALGRTGS